MVWSLVGLGQDTVFLGSTLQNKRDFLFLASDSSRSVYVYQPSETYYTSVILHVQGL